MPAEPAGRGLPQLRLVSLCCDDEELQRLTGFLTGEELQRGRRLIDERRRRHFLAGRGILRETLAALLGTEPAKLRLMEGEYGKLHLADPGEARRVSFNLSHAGDTMLLALAPGFRVGVDIERIREDLPFAGMARRYFSGRENEELSSLPPEEQLSAFYRCWTRKEAYLKGTGTGFSQPSDRFDVSLLPAAPPALLAHRLSPLEPARWRIEDVQVPEGYCAAVAFERL